MIGRYLKLHLVSPRQGCGVQYRSRARYSGRTLEKHRLQLCLKKKTENHEEYSPIWKKPTSSMLIRKTQD